jgi:hypothetical protein
VHVGHVGKMNARVVRVASGEQVVDVASIGVNSFEWLVTRGAMARNQQVTSGSNRGNAIKTLQVANEIRCVGFEHR